MQIQPQSNVNFRGKEHFFKTKEKNKIIARLEQQKISYKVVDNVVYSGKDLATFVKEQAYLVKLEQWEAKLIRDIKKWRQSKLEKAARMDALVNGKPIGTQGLRLRLKNKV